MEVQGKKSGWKIWVYLSPVYIILGILLFRWNAKINSSDVGLSKEEYNAFNTADGEIKKRKNDGYDPNLSDSGYSVRYRSGKAEPGTLPGDGPSPQAVAAAGKAEAARRDQENKAAGAGEAGGQGKGRSASQLALESNDTKAKEAMGMGSQKGYLSYAVGKVMGSPKAVSALLNNKYVVNGFMSRATVKAATGSAQGLANYLKGSGPTNFMNNPVVKAAMDNPAVVNAIASSGMISAMLNTPAAQDLMKDPQALNDLVTNNPQLMATLMSNPNMMNALMSNPDTAALMGKINK